MIKMRPLFGLLAHLLFLCLVHSCTGDTDSKTVVVFKKKETKVLYKGVNGESAERTPDAFYFPAFVGGMFKNKKFLAIISAARFYGTAGAVPIDGAVRTSYGEYNIWSAAEGFTNASEQNKGYRRGEDITAVMKNDKIYVLFTGYYEKSTSSSNGNDEFEWDPLMFVGTVGDSSGSAKGGASITWEEGKLLKSKLAKALQDTTAAQIVGGVGNGIVTKKSAIVFPIYLYLQDMKRTSSILYSEDDGVTWKIGKKTEDETYGGSVVEWGDGNLLLIVRSNKGYRRVFESGDMGNTWQESLVFSGVWGGAPNRRNSAKQGSAIKTPVDEKDVLLFAHPLTAKGGSSPDTLQLWLSDGQRIMCVGTISDEDNEHHSGKSILVNVGDHLYITHEINPDGVYGVSAKIKEYEQVIGFTPLPKFFASAKTTVRAWRKLDEWFVSKGVPTEGLVGFLKNTKKDNLQWDDAYKCVDATVNGGESVDGGFRFSGAPESRAEWPVSSQGQNQVYIFANKQFTLAATVTIHTGNANGQFLVIGASLESDENNVLIGLGYTHDNKWVVVSDGNQETITEETIKCEKEYHVALIFENRVASVYVDGLNIGGEKRISSSAPIHHFFMGGIKQSSTVKGNPCTLKNVMLFNQVLSQNKIAKLTQVSNAGKLDEEEETTTALPVFTTEDRTSMSSMNLTIIPESSKPVSTTQLKETSVISLQNVTNRGAHDTEIHKSLQNRTDSVLKKDTKGDIAVVGSMSAVGWMFFVCSLFALTGL